MRLIGKTLGKYRIVEQIGEGGMATVYKAYQANLDRFVALKILAPQHARTPGFRDRFFREAKSIARLSHVNILPVHDVGIEEDVCYIAMKYVAGANLSDIMGESMPLPSICRFIDQIAEALDHAHDSGIIHRDIKPSNLLLDGNWVFLTDFGIAKIMEASTVLTSTGDVMGTPAYMSPEQAMGRTLDNRTDIYSMGIVLYEMVTGRVPFTGETPYGIIFRHVHDPLPLPRDSKPDLPAGVERVILKALAKDPDHRYNRAGDFARALRSAVERAPRAISDETIPLSPPDSESTILKTPPPKPAPSIREPAAIKSPARNYRIVYGTVAAVSVLLLIVIGLFYSQSSGPSKEQVPIRSKGQSTSQAQTKPSLRVESNPRSASVYVDGVSKGTTPILIDLPMGPHIVEVALEGYKRWLDTVRFEEPKEYPIKVDLKPVALLLAESAPAGAEVYLNGELKGKTPLQSELLLGKHSIRMVKSGYREWSKDLELRESKKFPVRAELEQEAKTATIEIDSTPSGADIYMNNAYKGTTPLKSQFPFGKCTIRINKTGYKDLERTIQVKEQKEYSVAFDLTRVDVPKAESSEAATRVEAKSAFLKIESVPSGASVFVDGTLKGKTPTQSKVEFGSHTVRLELPGYRAWQSKVHLSESKEYLINEELEPVKETIQTPKPPENRKAAAKPKKTVKRSETASPRPPTTRSTESTSPRVVETPKPRLDTSGL